MVETRGGRRFAAVFLVAAFLVLFAGRWLKPVDDLALSAAAPFAAVISAISSGIGDTVGGVVRGPQYREQNRELQKRIEFVISQNVKLQDAAQENARLKTMLKFAEANNTMDLLPARVIGTDPANPTQYIIINRGARDRLRVGMTVVSYKGYFVGRITELTGNAAKILLVTSPSSSVGAIDLQTRAQGLVTGQFATAPQLDTVVASAKLKRGDFVVTSGQMNLFPRNLLLGQIVSIRHRDVDLFQSARIEPAADFQNLELVQVIRSFVPNAPTRLISGH